MRKGILSLVLLSGLLSVPVFADTLRLRDDAPQRYVVKKGDTLWAISGKFLKSPWRWPELWQMNKQEVKNPHWIYPGEVLVLASCDGKPCLKRERDIGVTGKLHPQIRTENLDGQAVTTLPMSIIRPFLTRPLVIEKDAMLTNPRVVAGPENRVMMAEGDKVYVVDLDKHQGQAGSQWQAYRPGKALIDPSVPEDKKSGSHILGYEAVYLGDASTLAVAEVSTLKLTNSVQEVMFGDRLTPGDAETSAAFVPHEVGEDFKGRVISAVGGVSEAGQYSVIVLNRGGKQGVERGHVVGLYKAGRLVKKETKGEPDRYTPSEQYGVAMIFRVFENVSYALVMESTDAVHVLDEAKKP